MIGARGIGSEDEFVLEIGDCLLGVFGVRCSGTDECTGPDLPVAEDHVDLHGLWVGRSDHRKQRFHALSIGQSLPRQSRTEALATADQARRLGTISGEIGMG